MAAVRVLILLVLLASRTVLTFADPAIDESSGLAVDPARPDVLFTHNDSGDVARFFAVGPDGRTLAAYRLPGVDAVDIEDMAVGPMTRGGPPMVWLADIGDNRGTRPSVALYVVPLPAVPQRPVGTVRTPAPTVWRLSYPGGGRDAEALAVDPVDGRAFVVTKSPLGLSTVYAVPPGGGVLTEVGRLRFSLTGTPGGPVGPVGQLAVTGASFSADGSRLVLRTYTDGYAWAVPGSDVAAALRRPPVRFPLPEQRQGEGVAVTPDGRSVLLSSEGVHQPVLEVPLPVATSSSAAASSQAQRPATQRPPTDRPATAPEHSQRATAISWAAAAAAALLLVLLALLLVLLVSRAVRRRSRRSR